MTRARYRWPASALTKSDMALLHRVRETAAVRVAITELLATAIRQTYSAASTDVVQAYSPAVAQRSAA